MYVLRYLDMRIVVCNTDLLFKTVSLVNTPTYLYLERTSNGHHNGVILPFWPWKTRTNKQFKKTRSQFCENMRTRWTGFIRWRTVFIRWADEDSPSANEASRQPMKPVLLILIFFPFFLFYQMFSFCLQREF